MRQPLLFTAAALLTSVGCGLFGRGGGGSSSPLPAATTARAEMRSATGQRLGDVTITQTSNGTLLLVGDLNGLPPGTHGFHFHTVGKCDPTFEAAGGHFNPTNRQHGFRNPNGSHGGDLPNINVPEGGMLRVEMVAHDISLSGNNRLLDADGSTIMIHALADDYSTDPSGASGGRIACGVITP